MTREVEVMVPREVEIGTARSRDAERVGSWSGMMASGHGMYYYRSPGWVPCLGRSCADCENDGMEAGRVWVDGWAG